MVKKSRLNLSDLLARVLSLLGFMLSLLIIADVYYSFVLYCHIFLVNLLIGLAAVALIIKLGMWFFKEKSRPKIQDYKRFAFNIYGFFIYSNEPQNKK